MIRRWLFIALALIPLHAGAESITPSERVRNGLNVREAPETDSTPLASLKPGEIVELLERVPLWYRIRLNDGTIGFVSKAWATVVPDAEPQVAGILAKAPEDLRVHFFNIGAGSCTLVECPGTGARPMVVDCGSFPGSRNDTDITDEDLKARFQDILSRYSLAPDVVLSHGDIDHYNLIPTVLEGIEINEIWRGDQASSYEAPVDAWIAEQKENDVPIRQSFPASWHNDGEEITDGLQCGDARAFVLTVNAGSSKNGRSLMLMIEYLDFTVVLTGDAEGDTERSAAENFEGTLRATVLTGSHHGANTEGSNGAAWAEAAAPKVMIYSAGSKYGHPRCAATDRMDDTLEAAPIHNARCGTSNTKWKTFTSDVAEYTTRSTGAITVTTDGKSPLRLNCEIGPGCETDIPF